MQNNNNTNNKQSTSTNSQTHKQTTTSHTNKQVTATNSTQTANKQVASNTNTNAIKQQTNRAVNPTTNRQNQNRSGNRDSRRPQPNIGVSEQGLKKAVSGKNKKNFKKDNKNFKGFKKSEFEERTIKIKRVSKTTKGGRRMSFSALVVIGNKKGKVGFGLGKALEVPNAIRKAIKNAHNSIQSVEINKGSIFHQIIGHEGAAKILLKPAPQGTGIIAGGPIRSVIELAGYTDIYTKNLGKNTPINMIRATIDGITKQLTPKKVASLRGKEIKDL